MDNPLRPSHSRPGIDAAMCPESRRPAVGSDNLDFDAFVEAVRTEQLEDELIHEAAHSSAVSTRTWQEYAGKVDDSAGRSIFPAGR
jgi:hypothetical protein